MVYSPCFIVKLLSYLLVEIYTTENQFLQVTGNGNGVREMGSVLLCRKPYICDIIHLV